jgi:hypothetical protein
MPTTLAASFLRRRPPSRCDQSGEIARAGGPDRLLSCSASFTVTLQHAVLRLQRAIILALVFLIDFCYFETSENNRNNNGIFLMS